MTKTCSSSTFTTDEGSPSVRAQQHPDLIPHLPVLQECSHKTLESMLTLDILRVADDGVQGLLFLALCSLCAVHPDSRNAGGPNIVPKAPMMQCLSLETCCSFC